MKLLKTALLGKLIEEGVDISCVQKILGHSSIKITQIYRHVAAKLQAEILREMHPRNQSNVYTHSSVTNAFCLAV